MKRGIVIAGLLLVATSVAACGEDDGESGDGAATEHTSAADGPSLVLHDAGAEPRQVMRITPVEGASEHATMTMTMGMAATLDGERQPRVTSPPMSMGMLIEITEVAENGDVTSRFEYDEVGVRGRGAAARQLEAALAPLEGVTGTLQVTGTGELIDADIDVPDDLDPIMASTLDSIEGQLGNLCPPMPEEPVGVGASWTTRATSAVNGIEGEATYEYTVVELTDDVMVLEVSYEQTADPQDVEAPGLPAGSSLHLESMAISGSGQVTVRIGALLPSESHVEGGGTLEMTAEADGEQMEMHQELEIGMELRAD